MSLDLSELRLPNGSSATLITDGNEGNLSFRQDTVTFTPGWKLELTLKQRGGFVMFCR
jgi:hypothetical protein